MSGTEAGDGYKDGPKDTIEVRGPENLINRYKLDLLQLYFESQGDIHGSITDISFDAVNAVVVIKFDSEQVAQRIIECQSHVLKGESLNIKLRQSTDIHSSSAQTTHAASIVRVSGLKRIEEKEIVEYYFENRRRSGGGPIKSFVPVESDGDIYDITFENTKDAQSVIVRRHVINGLSVDVILLNKDRETEYYHDRFLIKGLQENTSDEFLLYFIQAITGMKPKFLAFHKKEKDVVLVLMRYDLDIAQLIEQCKEETLEGAKIQIHEIEVSNVIHVSNLPENIHSDTILLYFENKRKSNGGIVKNVIRLDKSSCLVYFEDYKVTESVLGHDHALQRRDLTVRKYFNCVAQTEEEAFSTNIPQTVVIPDLDIRILKFIQQNEEFRLIVEQELLSHHAQVDWPKAGSDSCEVSINCIVDESKLLSNRVILRWKKEIKKVFKTFLDKIYVHGISITDEFNFDNSCVESTADNGENTLVLLDKGQSMITFVGTSPKLASTLRTRESFSGDTEEESKVERVSLTHAVELKMLRSLGYRDKIVKEVPNIFIKESEENLAVDFEGSPLNIRRAKFLMLEIKNELNAVFFYPLSIVASNLYLKLPTVDFVNKRLLSAGLDCIWSVSHTKLIICCHNKYDPEICMDVIKASVIDDVIHQHTTKVDRCDMGLYEKKKNEIEATYPGKVAISFTRNYDIHLCSTKDIRDAIFEEFRAIIKSQKEINESRSKGETFEFPAHWDDMKGGNLRVVSLSTGTLEYTAIEKQFKDSVGQYRDTNGQQQDYTIVKIERIQNKVVWEQYHSKKKQLESQNPSGTINERELWHGTSADSVDSINAHGFNRSYCGKNACLYGNGVSFAVLAMFSCQSALSRPDSSGIKRMYLSKVLTGVYARGFHGMRYPPSNLSGGPHALYDSVTDDTNHPRTFVIFNDTQACPIYLIYFKE